MNGPHPDRPPFPSIVATSSERTSGRSSLILESWGCDGAAYLRHRREPGSLVEEAGGAGPDGGGSGQRRRLAQAGSRFRAGQWAGRTAVKWRRSRVATSVMFSPFGQDDDSVSVARSATGRRRARG